MIRVEWHRFWDGSVVGEYVDDGIAWEGWVAPPPPVDPAREAWLAQRGGRTHALAAYLVACWLAPWPADKNGGVT